LVHKYPDRLEPIRKIHVLWVVRLSSQINWFGDVWSDIEKLHSNIFELEFHVTRDDEGGTHETLLITYPSHQKIPIKDGINEEESANIFCNYEYKKGRPDLRAYLRKLQETYINTDHICVMVCGPPDMEQEINVHCSELTQSKLPDLAFSSQSYVI